MKISLRLLLLGIFPCMISCAGTANNSPLRKVDLFDCDDSVRMELFEAKPMSRLAVEVDARTEAVPFGTNDIFHVGTYHLTDSTKSCFVYTFSLTPESVDTVSATTLRYHFTLGRKGRLMLLSANHPDDITSAFEHFDRRTKKGWI